MRQNETVLVIDGIVAKFQTELFSLIQAKSFDQIEFGILREHSDS